MAIAQPPPQKASQALHSRKLNQPPPPPDKVPLPRLKHASKKGTENRFNTKKQRIKEKEKTGRGREGREGKVSLFVFLSQVPQHGPLLAGLKFLVLFLSQIRENGMHEIPTFGTMSSNSNTVYPYWDVLCTIHFASAGCMIKPYFLVAFINQLTPPHS